MNNKHPSHLSLLTMKMSITLAFLIAISSQAIAKQEYFRWTDKNGTTHYSKTPPRDVNSKKVTTRSEVKAEGKRYQDPDLAYEKSQKEVKEERKKTCDKEKKRLETLRTSGADIRMIDENGEQKILTKDDIQKEIKASENFIAQAC